MKPSRKKKTKKNASRGKTAAAAAVAPVPVGRAGRGVTGAGKAAAAAVRAGGRATGAGRAAATRVVVLACKWHPLESMENALADGYAYDPGIMVLPVRCTGGITLASMLKLFASELEGVLILGCEEGDCHYFNGSKRCGEIVAEAREILEWSGIAPERLGFALMTGSEGKRFVEALEGYMKTLGAVRQRRRKRAA